MMINFLSSLPLDIWIFILDKCSYQDFESIEQVVQIPSNYKWRRLKKHIEPMLSRMSQPCSQPDLDEIGGSVIRMINHDTDYIICVIGDKNTPYVFKSIVYTFLPCCQEPLTMRYELCVSTNEWIKDATTPNNCICAKLQRQQLNERYMRWGLWLVYAYLATNF